MATSAHTSATSRSVSKDGASTCQVAKTGTPNQKLSSLELTSPSCQSSLSAANDVTDVPLRKPVPSPSTTVGSQVIIEPE